VSEDNSSSARKRRSVVDQAEEQAWLGFYRRVGDPSVAAEVMHELQSDPEMKRAHLALYLRCKESLREEKARLARNKRIAVFVRMFCAAVFVSPARGARRLLGRSSDIAIECLPATRAEPAARQVRKLTAIYGRHRCGRRTAKESRPLVDLQIGMSGRALQRRVAPAPFAFLNPIANWNVYDTRF
jgi:hypothetical protein